MIYKIDDYENAKNNQVKVMGIICAEPELTHKIYGEGFYRTYIKAIRLSETYDQIPITISERLLVNLKLEEGTPITVTGQFRSYNMLENGHSKLMLSVFAKDIQYGIAGGNPNYIKLTGRICKPPIFRKTPFEREIADVLIAVNRQHNKSDYIPTITWGRNARFAQTLTVGQKVMMEGRIQSRLYNKVLEDGSVEERTTYEVSVSKITLVTEDNQKQEVSVEQSQNQSEWSETSYHIDNAEMTEDEYATESREDESEVASATIDNKNED